MKKLLLSFFVLLFVGGNVFAGASSKSDSKDAIPIPIVPYPSPINPKPIPRQLADCNIEAFYADGTIMLEFAEDMGYVSVVVINETTGESWVDGVDGCGSATISISDMAGYYTITISTTSGDYYGEFTL